MSSNDLVLCETDKGNTVTILSKADYSSKMNKILNTDDFVELKNNPTKKLHSYIHSLVKINPISLENFEAKNLPIMNIKVPILWTSENS